MPWVEPGSEQASRVNDAVRRLFREANTRFGSSAPHVSCSTGDTVAGGGVARTVTANLDDVLFSPPADRLAASASGALPGMPPCQPHREPGCRTTSSTNGGQALSSSEGVRSHQCTERACSSELQRYIDMAAAPSSYTIAYSPLQWWGSTGAQRFPLLQAAARCALVIPVSTVRPSVCFGGKQRLVAERRRRLVGNSGAALVFLSENLHELRSWVDRHAPPGTEDMGAGTGASETGDPTCADSRSRSYTLPPAAAARDCRTA